MVQRVPAHLGETTHESLSPWLMIGGLVLLLLVVCIVVFVLLGGMSRFGFGAVSATPTRTPTLAPAITIIPITLPPASEVAPGPTAAIVKYKVKAGDTLTAIASHYKVSVQSIMTANGMTEDTIRIGQELTIPLPTPTPEPGAQSLSPPGGTPTSISFQSPPTSGTPADTPGVIRHTVQRGDTLISIAASNGSTVDAIRAANRLDSDFLSVGQVLLVPVGSWTATATATLVPDITATPTSQYAYSAPDLLQPQDQGTVASSDSPMLSWTSPATLKSNEFYVVHIERSSNGERVQLPSLPVRQGNSVRLARSTYYAGPNAAGSQYSWWVVVVTQPPGTNEPPAAQSPPSATRTFTWY